VISKPKSYAASFRGAREAASPESMTTGRGLWIPGSPPSVAPRNDQAPNMIGFMESLHYTIGPRKLTIWFGQGLCESSAYMLPR
jgi:hypothetical protein